MAKECAFKQIHRHGAGIDGNEGPISPRTRGVNRLGHQLFSRPAFARDQHRSATGGDLRDQVINFLHALALANHVGQAKAFQGAAKLDVFHLQF